MGSKETIRWNVIGLCLSSILITSCLHDAEETGTQRKQGEVTLLGATVVWDSIFVNGTLTGFDTLSVELPAGYFDNYVQPVFEDNCITCHTRNGGGWLTTGGSLANGLDLTAGNSYDLTVNIESFKNPPMNRIEPGSLTNSFLYLKITQENPPGEESGRMPPTAPLDIEDITKIKFWIQDGAPRN